MQVNYFQKDTKTVYAARSEAERIAFAPIVFQVCRVLRNAGVLERVKQGGAAGMTMSEISAGVDVPRYGLKVLLESGLGIGLFCLNDERYTLTKLGRYILRDPITRVNMDFVHDVCYRGMFDLDRAISEGKPSGLKSLGDWPTVYEGLSSLPPPARESWMAFDHFYSNMAFPEALRLVFADRPHRLLDVGGNTGEWAVECAQFDPAVHVTIADLPQQLALALENIRVHRLEDRVDCHAIDVLDERVAFPTGYEAIWMSQFLACFSEREITSILRRAAASMAAGAHLYILELFWDRQPNEIAAFCLQQTSLYFTCIATGKSQMYRYADMLRCIAESGLVVTESRDEVGQFHTLLKCRKA